MASKQIRPKNKSYGAIQRGCSLTIPVSITDEFEVPFDLTEYTASFTVKRVPFDYDREDVRAYIHKDFTPQEPEQGKFFIQLSSKDTDIPPGEYFFDVELIHQDSGAVYRMCTLVCCIEGGPTNRNVNDGIGQLAVGDQISIITIEQGAPIVVIAPTVNVSSEIYTKIAELENDVASINSTIEGIENQITTMEEDIAKLKEAGGGDEERLAKVEADLLAAQQELETLAADLETAQSAISQTQSDITLLKTRVTATEDSIISIRNTVLQLGDDLITLRGTVSGLSIEINQLTTRVTAVEDKVITLQNDMVQVKSDISTLEGDITSLAGDVSKAQADILTNETNITKNTNDITQLKTDVDAIVSFPEAPEDGKLYGRMDGEWVESNKPEPNVVYINSSSTETYENGSIRFPFKSYANAKSSLTFGDIVDIDPGGLTEDFVIDVDNLTLRTDGTIGQYRVKITGNVTVNAVRCGLENLFIAGDLELNDNLTYCTNVAVDNVICNTTGYSRFTNSFFNKTVKHNTGLLGIYSSQFESGTTVEIESSATLETFYSQGGEVTAHGAIMAIGWTMASFLSDANAPQITWLQQCNLINTNTQTLQPINITGSSPYALTNSVYDLPNSTLIEANRIPYGADLNDEIVSNFIPTNYTPTSMFATGHLAGIDAALASSGGGGGLEPPTGVGNYIRSAAAWLAANGQNIEAGYTPTLFNVNDNTLAEFLRAAETYAGSVATPFARFIKRTGGAIVQWTSPTTFMFTGGAYIQMSTRGQIRTMTFSQQSLNYSGGVFICFDNTTQTLTTYDMVNVITLPVNYYIVGWMLQSPNGNPSVHVIDGGDYEYVEDTDHSVIGDISTLGATIELEITGTILSRLTSTGANTCKLEIIGTTTINNIDIRRMSQYGDASEGAAFNGITLTTAGQVIDDTIYMDSTDGGKVWICNGNAWYEMTFFVSGGGARARMVAHKLN